MTILKLISMLNMASDVLLWVWIVIRLIDQFQTHDIKNHPGMYEKNWILGRHPDDDKIRIYFLVTNAVAIGLVYFLLPLFGLEIFTGLVIWAMCLGSGFVIAKNHYLGLRPNL